MRPRSCLVAGASLFMLGVTHLPSSRAWGLEFGVLGVGLWIKDFRAQGFAHVEILCCGFAG